MADERSAAGADGLDGLKEGLVLVEDGVVTRINRAAARMLGTEPSHDDRRPLIAVVRDHRIEQLATVGDVVELAVRGRRLEVERIAGGFALRDVSAERRAEENARDLLAVLSHELRTPVTTVRAALDALLAYDLAPDERDRMVRRAVAEAERLSRLLDDLTVDVAPPRQRSVALPPVIERVRSLLEPRLAAHDVRLAVEVPDLAVWADPDKVVQLLLNLVENAVVHGPDDATVEVVAEAEGDRVRLAVRDRGEPLDPEDRRRLFAPHVRGRRARGPGVGVGLYVVRSIVVRAGGRVGVDVWAGPDGAAIGNEFWIVMPSRRPDGGANGNPHGGETAEDGRGNVRDPSAGRSAVTAR